MVAPKNNGNKGEKKFDAGDALLKEASENLKKFLSKHGGVIPNDVREKSFDKFRVTFFTFANHILDTLDRTEDIYPCELMPNAVKEIMKQMHYLASLALNLGSVANVPEEMVVPEKMDTWKEVQATAVKDSREERANLILKIETAIEDPKSPLSNGYDNFLAQLVLPELKRLHKLGL